MFRYKSPCLDCLNLYLFQWMVVYQAQSSKVEKFNLYSAQQCQDMYMSNI